MSNRLKILTVLLLLQSIMTVILFLPKAQNNLLEQQMLTFSVPDITEITIKDNETQSMRLLHADGVWTLPDYQQLPVDDNKVKILIHALSTEHQLTPIANTPQSQERFEVADKKYQRMVLVKDSAQKEYTLYIGQQAGVKKSYVRVKGEQDIYEYPLAHHELSAVAQDWFKRELLRPEKMTKIEGVDFTLVKSENEWRLQEKLATKPLHQENVDTIVTQIEYMNALALVDAKEVSRLKEPKQVLTVMAGDKPIKYSIFDLDDKRVIKADFHPNYFYVANPFADSLTAWRKASFEQEKSS